MFRIVNQHLLASRGDDLTDLWARRNDATPTTEETPAFWYARYADLRQRWMPQVDKSTYQRRVWQAPAGGKSLDEAILLGDLCGAARVSDRVAYDQAITKLVAAGYPEAALVAACPPPPPATQRRCLRCGGPMYFNNDGAVCPRCDHPVSETARPAMIPGDPDAPAVADRKQHHRRLKAAGILVPIRVAADMLGCSTQNVSGYIARSKLRAYPDPDHARRRLVLREEIEALR
jgi:hypothetical protein